MPKSKVSHSNKNTNKNKIHIVINHGPHGKRKARRYRRKATPHAHRSIAYHTLNPPLLPPPIQSYQNTSFPTNQRDPVGIPMNNEVKDNMVELYQRSHYPVNETPKPTPLPTPVPTIQSVQRHYHQPDEDRPFSQEKEPSPLPISEIKPTHSPRHIPDEDRPFSPIAISNFSRMSKALKEKVMKQHGLDTSYHKKNHEDIIKELSDKGALKRLRAKSNKAMPVSAEHISELYTGTPASARGEGFSTPQTVGKRLQKQNIP